MLSGWGLWERCKRVVEIEFGSAFDHVDLG